LLNRNAVTDCGQRLRRGLSLGPVGLGRSFHRGPLRLPILLALQLLCKTLDLQLLRSQSIFQSLDIGSGRRWRRGRWGGLFGSRRI
jgi:hypothetical protein